jgi:hypothetical protein
MTAASTWVCILAFLALEASAAVSADEARQLGSSLTPMGAQAAGNASRTIPAYTGGLTRPPAGFQPGSGLRPDPFADDKPLYAVHAADLAAHEAQLTAGTKELLKRYRTMRLDVYPTQRSVAFPKFIVDNTLKNATSATTTDGGLSVRGVYPGLPFPIPKTGQEVMWNHLLRYPGPAQFTKYDSFNIDATGRAVLSTTGELYTDHPFQDPKRQSPSTDDELLSRLRLSVVAPARRVGEALLVHEYLNPMKHGRMAWQYLPGQRRVKLAPNVAYDTPNPGSAGVSTYDDSFVFNGAMDRYDWKLLGKREMLVPYNSFRLAYARDSSAITTPGHVNPDFVRWELHRVWVVEATLLPGKRHIYARRVFYVDEDSWIALASDEYDARGQLFRAGFLYLSTLYEVPAPAVTVQSFHDFSSGSYSVLGLVGAHGVGVSFLTPLSAQQWSADALAGDGVR